MASEPVMVWSPLHLRDIKDRTKIVGWTHIRTTLEQHFKMVETFENELAAIQKKNPGLEVTKYAKPSTASDVPEQQINPICASHDAEIKNLKAAHEAEIQSLHEQLFTQKEYDEGIEITQQACLTQVKELIKRQTSAIQALKTQHQAEKKAIQQECLLQYKGLLERDTVKKEAWKEKLVKEYEVMKDKLLKEQAARETSHLAEIKLHQDNEEIMVQKMIDLKDEFAKVLQDRKMTTRMAALICKCDEISLQKNMAGLLCECDTCGLPKILEGLSVDGPSVSGSTKNH